jgi:ABC-2 type transport system ATP-binding protein
MDILELKGVCKSFSRGFFGRRKSVLRDLSLHIRQGEVFGLLGHNGAGKTTTMRIGLGILRGDRGQIRLFGDNGATKAARKRIGYLSDDLGLNPTFTAAETLRFTADLFRLSAAEGRKRTERLLDLVGLRDSANTKIAKYSKGMRQRLGLAVAIINNPDLLVLDEPYSGLDPIGRRDVRRLLLELKNQGKTILISSHIVPDVEAVCDRVGVLNEGSVQKCLDLKEIVRQKSDEVEITLSGVKESDFVGVDPKVQRVFANDEVLVLRCEGKGAKTSIIHRVLNAGGSIVELKPLRFNLEDYLFEALTDNASRPRGDMLQREIREYAHQ